VLPVGYCETGKQKSLASDYFVRNTESYITELINSTKDKAAEVPSHQMVSIA
jgi:hypothetical protein